MSCKFCRAALDAFELDNKEFFLVDAGVALEQLAKAYLASLNRTLVAESDFDSLLHASGQSRHARRPPQRMRSISMKEALDRCGQLLPGIMQLDSDLQLLREVRNGVAHLGLAAERADDLLVPFLQAAELLLAELDESDWVFFGDKTQWVQQTLARNREGTASSACRSGRRRSVASSPPARPPGAGCLGASCRSTRGRAGDPGRARRRSGHRARGLGADPFARRRLRGGGRVS